MSSKVQRIDPSSNVLVVDASYYVFHRFFATHRWYSFKTQLPEGAATTAKEFIEAFLRHVQQDIRKWRKQWAIPSNNVFFCFDCARHDIWRNQHADGYKGTRVHSSNFDSNIFQVFYEWFDHNAEEQGLASLSVDGLEADDVAYLCVQEILQHMDESHRVIILTNDNDYLQMRTDKVTIVNAQGYDLSKRSIGTAEQDLIYKILLGDTSDNIASVCSRLGAATAKKLALASHEERWAWIQKKGVACEEAYRKNEQLISFQHIPSSYIMAWKAKYTWSKK